MRGAGRRGSRRVHLLLAPFLCAISAAAPALAAEAPVSAVEEVAAWLAGTFDSKAQASRDPEFHEVRLVAVPVPRSRLALGAPVLYVEQALFSSPDRPYRQRFQRIEDGGDGKVLSRVFEPKDPIALSGKWREPADLALFGPGDVVERRACLVTLRKAGDHWEGGTEGDSCPSALQGARYVTSRVRLFADRLESWDQGFDVTRKQVWGAVTGPYVFTRRPAP